MHASFQARHSLERVEEAAAEEEEAAAAAAGEAGAPAAAAQPGSPLLPAPQPDATALVAVASPLASPLGSPLGSPVGSPRAAKSPHASGSSKVSDCPCGDSRAAAGAGLEAGRAHELPWRAVATRGGVHGTL